MFRRTQPDASLTRHPRVPDRWPVCPGAFQPGDLSIRFPPIDGRLTRRSTVQQPNGPSTARSPIRRPEGRWITAVRSEDRPTAGQLARRPADLTTLGPKAFRRQPPGPKTVRPYDVRPEGLSPPASRPEGLPTLRRQARGLSAAGQNTRGCLGLQPFHPRASWLASLQVRGPVVSQGHVVANWRRLQHKYLKRRNFPVDNQL